MMLFQHMLMMAVVPNSRRPLLRQTSEAFSVYFYLERGKNKQKMPKSPRTSTPGERKAWEAKPEAKSPC